MGKKKKQDMELTDQAEVTLQDFVINRKTIGRKTAMCLPIISCGRISRQWCAHWVILCRCIFRSWHYAVSRCEMMNVVSQSFIAR